MPDVIRRIGKRGWVTALVVVVAVLAAIGWTVFGTSDERQPAGAASTISAPGPAPGNAEPGQATTALTLTRAGNNITLTGSVPDSRSKDELVSAVKAQWVNATLNDQTDVVEGAGTPDLAGIGNVLSTADPIADFGLSLDGNAVTLMGTAPNLDVAAQVQEAAALAFPGAKMANNIQIPAPGGPAAPPATVGPSAPAPAIPAPGGPCATLQSDISALLRTPISFITGGSQLTAESRQVLVQIAEKITACPNVAVNVVGYTDNVGSDAINLKLSDSRAKAVAAALVSNGVLAAKVTARGAGSANPIADNSTEAGRAQNRRVEITVS